METEARLPGSFSSSNATDLGPRTGLWPPEPARPSAIGTWRPRCRFTPHRLPSPTGRNDSSQSQTPPSLSLSHMHFVSSALFRCSPSPVLPPHRPLSLPSDLCPPSLRRLLSLALAFFFSPCIPHRPSSPLV
jgi:hypothetical protein